MLNLFYSEPDFDRWVPFDRFPRKIVRRLLRGPVRPGGQMRVFLNLCAGLDRLGHPYRVNDHRHAKNNPGELACILGKRHVLEERPWANPLLVGPCVHDHPIEDPELFRRRRVRRILVPGEWMRRMCEPYWGDRVQAWPVGLDTDHWAPANETKARDFILYNKIRWDQAQRESTLLAPIRAELQRRGLTFTEIRYGSYAPEDYRTLLASSRAMLFVCEHETQGIAYQEALSSGVPVLAWDHGGEWLDPSFHPQRIRYGPVSSVPYWDDRCGLRFREAADFPAVLENFVTLNQSGRLDPRAYVLEHLTLAGCAAQFVAQAKTAATLDDAPALDSHPAR